MKGLCPHDRSIGHVCLKCPSGTAEEMVWGHQETTYPLGSCAHPVNSWADACIVNSKMNSGLDCDYYDFPESIHSAQDMIEWLNLNFANGNILKSLIRESGAATKETDTLYEAEKRYFFAGRELERVRNLPCGEEARQRLSNGVKTG